MTKAPAPDNLALWKQVEKTDPDAVKPITGKPYKGNSPRPHYLIQKATEIFGPCGIGWGFRIIQQMIVDGAPGEKVHIAHIGLWYEWKGQRAEIEHVGQTMFSGKRNNGTPYTDEDAPKKSVTDALVKALSMIGFAGDIFSGRWDDSGYVQELREEKKREEVEDEVAAYVLNGLKVIQNFDNASDLGAWWRGETDDRHRLRIIKGEPDYETLYNAVMDRGAALTTETAK